MDIFSYTPSVFTIDLSGIDCEKGIEPQYKAAFVHEYCHYLQDVTTISGIFGFSLLLWDISQLSNELFSEKKKVITIPYIDSDLGSYRKFYSIYCGDSNKLDNFPFENMHIEEIHREVEEIPLAGQNVNFGDNIIRFRNKMELRFGLICLQESQAFLVQKIYEQKLEKVDEITSTKNIKGIKYKICNLICDYCDVKIDDEILFVLLDLCLDSVQAPTVFIETVKALTGRELRKKDNIEQSLKEIIDLVHSKSNEFSFGNQAAFDNIIPDLEQWSKDPQRKYFSEALQWYISIITTSKTFRDKSPGLISINFLDLKGLDMLLRIFPPPIIKCNEQYYRFNFPSEIVNEKILDDNFKAAAVFQLMRVIYDLLLSKTREQFNQNIACPAFESCEFGFRDEYICKRSPWKIKEKSVNTTCYYGMALFNYGLFKDDIDLDVSKMT